MISRKNQTILIALTIFLTISSNSHAVTLTFNDAISGATSYAFDADLDGLPDAVLSTTDPLGFNTVGPGPNMTYIQEPGLEGTTTLAPDLRVDFGAGAVGSLGFGFAMSASIGGANTSVIFSVFDAVNTLLATTTVPANFTAINGGRSSFPEGIVSLAFLGTAKYATLDFNSANATRYIIDNFTGTFGTTERPSVPEPGILALLSLGLLAITVIRRRNTL